MKGPGTIFETEFASVVALPRRGEKSLRFAPFPVRLGSRERLLLFLGAEFKERERGGGEEDLDGHRRWNDRSSAAFFVLQRDSRSVALERSVSFDDEPIFYFVLALL